MKKMIKWLVLMGGVLALSPDVQAQDEPAEVQITWDDSTRLALAQCLVGEAGWRNRTEHAIIAHLLERRWRQVMGRHPTWTYERMIRRYCSVHRVREPSARHRWVRALPWGEMTVDPGLGTATDWRNYIAAWDFVRETVAMFEAGTLPDPMPDAEHWGGHMDSVPLGGVLLARVIRSIEDRSTRVSLNNYFYRIDVEVARRYRAARRAAEAGGPYVLPASIASGGRI
jgi:hypothetical protein